MLPDSCANSQTQQSHVHGSVPANPGVPFADPDLEHLGSEGVGKITLSGEEAFVQWALGGGDKQNPEEALLCRVTLSLASLRKQLLGFSGFTGLDLDTQVAQLVMSGPGHPCRCSFHSMPDAVGSPHKVAVNRSQRWLPRLSWATLVCPIPALLPVPPCLQLCLPGPPTYQKP